MTSLLLIALFVPAAPAADEDDPEPPVKTGLVTRLVAKKSTYSLDFGGKKKEDYLTAAKAGTLESPKVDLELVIANYTKETIRIRSTGGTNRLMLKLEGDGAVSATVMVDAVRPPTQYSVLEPKEKLTIPIQQLSSLARVLKSQTTETRLYWTEPGDYKLSASLYTQMTTDFGGPNPVARNQTFEAKAITLKVEEK